MEGSQAQQPPSTSSDFVRKLYKMLENPQDESVVRWGNDGNSFVVLENEKFTKHILPKHFKHSNFASFVRQLNKYDFHKVRHNNDEGGVSPYGPGAWEFMHPDFRMNNKDALDNIRRKAPAPRKLNVRSEETASQHLHTLQERFNELQSLYSMQCQELHHLRKVAANHETIMGNILNFLISNQKRQEGKPVPFATETANTESNEGADNEGVSIATLEQAIKMLGHYNGEQSVSSRPLEQMSEVQARLHAAITPPPDFSQRNVPPSPHAGPQSAKSSISYGDLDRMAYPPPVGMRMFPDPYALAAKQPPPPPPPPAVPFHVADVSVKKESVDAKHWVRRPRVLLVEDDPTCQRISTKFLEAFQCSIETALDGSEAVARLDGRAKYDLILMDIIMPNLDGISATHLIRQFDSTPIIAMTSNIRHDDINMYFQHGMNDVLPKPFTKDGLFNLLEKHMAHLKKPSSEVRPALPVIDTRVPPVPQPSQASVGVAAPQSAIGYVKRALKQEDSPTTPSPGGVISTTTSAPEEVAFMHSATAAPFTLTTAIPPTMFTPPPAAAMQSGVAIAGPTRPGPGPGPVLATSMVPGSGPGLVSGQGPGPPGPGPGLSIAGSGQSGNRRVIEEISGGPVESSDRKRVFNG